MQRMYTLSRLHYKLWFNNVILLQNPVHGLNVMQSHTLITYLHKYVTLFRRIQYIKINVSDHKWIGIIRSNIKIACVINH